jgi:hypothetical protein
MVLDLLEHLVQLGGPLSDESSSDVVDVIEVLDHALVNEFIYFTEVDIILE